jgi:CBS domain-containing protein
MKVKEIMNKAVTESHDIKVRDAAKIMSDGNIGSLILVNGDKIAGIVTDDDILKNINKLDSGVSKVMSKNVISIDENEGIDRAAEIMRERKIKRLPVVKKGKLVGIITATDLIANSEELNEEFFFD